MKRERKPNLKAEAAYESAHLVAQDQIERIKELLFDLPAPGVEETPIHWGHVGTVSHINQQLSEMIAFLESANR
jgi:hypothetical protein